MALKYKGATTIIGLSTDTKPTTVPAGTRFYVEDDGYREQMFDGLSWNDKITIEDDRFYDDFEAGTFNFTEGSVSPNGKWKNKFLGTGDVGSGTSGVRFVSGVGNVMYIKTGVSNVSNHTTATVNYTPNDFFQDFELTCRMRTVAQLRINSAPNGWEAAWIVWRVGDITGQMGYYFVIKTNGCEFGKSDNLEGSPSNYILATPGSPTCTMGQWYNIRIKVVGNIHKVWVDGVLVINYEDISPKDAPLPSRQIQRSGSIVLYAEDAEVEFDNIRVLPVYPTSLIDYDQSVHNSTPLPSSNRKSGAYYGTTGGATPQGDNLLSGVLARVGSSDAQVIDDLGIHRSFTTGAAAGNQAGISTNVVLFRRSHNLVLRGKFKLPSTTVSESFWFGFSNSATIANSADPLNNLHGFLVGYRADGGVWGIISNNNSATNAVLGEGLAMTANEWVNVYMELQSAGKCIVRLNNRTPVIITAVGSKPGVSTSMYLHCVLTTTTTATRTITIDHFDIEVSPGNDVP